LRRFGVHKDLKVVQAVADALDVLEPEQARHNGFHSELRKGRGCDHELPLWPGLEEKARFRIVERDLLMLMDETAGERRLG
jgi:hypothetical protein